MILAIGIGAFLGAFLTLALIAWLLPDPPQEDDQTESPETPDDF